MATKAKAKKAAKTLPAWAEPYPASVLKEVKRGDKAVMEETVFVRAVPTSDLTVNGTKLPAGIEVTVGADFAHQHVSALTAPKDPEA